MCIVQYKYIIICAIMYIIIYYIINRTMCNVKLVKDINDLK